jgi:pyruvate kinase
MSGYERKTKIIATLGPASSSCVIDCRCTICQDAVVSVGKKRYVKIEFTGK